MIRRPPRSTRTDTLFPYTTLFRSGLLYRSILVGDVTLRYMHEDREYPNRLIFSLAAGVEQDGLKVDRAVLAVTRPIGARLTGSASLSYIWTKPDVSVYEDFKGTGWSAELDYIVGPKLNVGISASRDVTSSAAIDSSYQISRILVLYANYRLRLRPSIQAGPLDAKRRFRGQFDNPLYPTLPERGTEKTRQYHASATYSPTERWKVSLRYLHENRDSTGSLYDYTGNTVSLSGTRSEARRVGKEGGSTWRTRWSPDH